MGSGVQKDEDWSEGHTESQHPGPLPGILGYMEGVFLFMRFYSSGHLELSFQDFEKIH